MINSRAISLFILGGAVFVVVFVAVNSKVFAGHSCGTCPAGNSCGFDGRQCCENHGCGGAPPPFQSGGVGSPGNQICNYNACSGGACIGASYSVPSGQTCAGNQCANWWDCAPPCDPNNWGGWSGCSASCGGGSQSRSNACGSTQTQSCNTQPCCTNSAPAPYLLSPAANQSLPGSAVSLNWGVSGWGTNCSGNSNSATVYVQECPELVSPTTVLASGLPASQTSIGYSGQYTKSYCWAVRASNGALSTQTFPRRWTFTESNWWQVVGGGVTAAGDVISKVAPGQVFVTDPAGVVVSGSGSTNFNGQPVSSTNWLVANAASRLSTSLMTNASFTEIARTVDGLVTPVIISSPVVDTAQLTPLAGLADGAYYVQIKGDADLAVNGPLDVGTAQVVLLVAGNVNIKNKINLTDNQGFFMVAASGNINIDPAVGTPAYQTATPDLEGIYFAQGAFNTGSSATNYLRIAGSVTGMNGVNSQRQMYSLNPAETYVFRPEMAVFAPSGVLRKQRLWEEVAP